LIDFEEVNGIMGKLHNRYGKKEKGKRTVKNKISFGKV
jgi:hypothetical protein